MRKDDGGPAFPGGSYDPATGAAQAPVYYGMTLRDWFAGRAMQGIVGSIDSEENYDRLRGHAAAEGLRVSEWIARDAYKQADAMIAARTQEETDGR